MKLHHVFNAALLIAMALMVGTILSNAPPSLAADDQTPKRFKGHTGLAYQIDKQTTAYRSAVSSADTDDEVAWSAIADFGLNGMQNISVSGRFSGSAADTATIKIAYYYTTTHDSVTTENYLGSSSVVTLTALAGIDQNDDNEAAVVAFDGRGANMVKVIVLSVSAGNVDLWVGSY